MTPRLPSSLLPLLLAFHLLVLGTGCAREFQPPPCVRPDLGGCAVEDIDIKGNSEVGGSDITSRIATAESSHMLAGALQRVPVLSILDTLTVDYERFDRFVLERDLARVERYYRARGFYSARVRATRVQKIDADEGGRVQVTLVVEEGQPVNVTTVDLQWTDWDLAKGQAILGPVTDAKNSLKLGERFEEEKYEATKEEILRALTDRGFAYAKVDGKVNVDVVNRQARVVYTITLGPPSRFGKITIEGLGELPERPFRAALEADEGDEFSTDALEESEQALSEFGVFGAIDVQVQRAPEGQPPNPVVPVTFRVQPAALRSVRLGAGAEFGNRDEVHLVAGWENRNFLGGARRFSIEARPGLVFYPSLFSGYFWGSPRVLPELQIRSELRQPAFAEARTSAVLRGSARIYRLQAVQNLTDELEALEEGVEPPIVGYREIAGATGFERPFIQGDVNASLLYNVQFNDPFTYNDIALPAGYDDLLLAYFQTTLALDLRRNLDDDPERVDPRKGIYVGLDAQLAGYLWGHVNDVRLQPEFRAYIPVSKKVTLATRVLFGALFPQNYATAFGNQDACLALPPDSPGRTACEPDLIRDIQKLQFRGFFSGGASSNRGYGYNEVGPHGDVRSLTGIAESNVPTGGLTLWEASLELRIPIVGSLGTAIFVDGSDVTRKTMFYRLSRPHLSAGFGLRYATPVGPLRADVGYRIPCVQVLGVCPGEDLPVNEGKPGTVAGLPIAVSIAIGEAF